MRSASFAIPAPSLVHRLRKVVDLRSLTSAPANHTIPLYAKPADLLISHGTGSFLYDSNNKQYIDFTAGIAVCALGHADKQVAQILYDQANTLVHISNLYRNKWQEHLAAQLVELLSPAPLSHVFLCNSGTEAIEASIKFSRAFNPDPAVYKILTFENGFHGRSMGALSATFNPKYQSPFQPLVPGFKCVKYNDMQAAEHELRQGGYCAVLVEPIQGEGGIQLGTSEFLVNLRRLATELNVLLIFDEIQCGLARTGQLFAFNHANVSPDILCLAKPLANGVPIGATIVTERVALQLKQGIHGTTFGGNPLAARLACHVLDRLADPALLAHVNAMSGVLFEYLDVLKQKFPGWITDVRGRGLLVGLELCDPDVVNHVVAHAREKGLLICTAGKLGNVLRIVPPLIITRDQLVAGLDIISSCLEQYLHKQHKSD